MAPQDSLDRAPAGTSVARSWHGHWFAGLNQKGIALIAFACLLNAVRRVEPFDEGYVVSVLQNFGTSLIVLFPTTLAAAATFNRAPSAPWWRYSALVLAVAITCAAGTAVAGVVEAHGWIERLVEQASRQDGTGWRLFGYWLRYVLLGYLFAAVFVYFRLLEDDEAATRNAELDRARSEAQMDEARLQMLQAQIEPHFLFNTLANVRRLYQSGPAIAESVLENLMQYLAIALPQMRVAHSTLGREVALAESFLNIQQIRMGRRLVYRIDIPESLRDASVPPMMVLTLVENAIKHGLSPLPEGGLVRVSALVESGQLRVQVADSGQGFTKTSGGGTGLANTRARLAALYGRAAQLNLEPNQPRGVTATITLPFPAITSAGTRQ